MVKLLIRQRLTAGPTMNLDEHFLSCATMLTRLDAVMADAQDEARHTNALEGRLRRLLCDLEAEQPLKAAPARALQAREHSSPAPIKGRRRSRSAASRTGQRRSVRLRAGLPIA